MPDKLPDILNPILPPPDFKVVVEHREKFWLGFFLGGVCGAAGSAIFVTLFDLLVRRFL